MTLHPPAEGRLAVFDFIEGWYNPTRRHSALPYLSPLEFERHGGGVARTPAQPAATEAVA